MMQSSAQKSTVSQPLFLAAVARGAVEQVHISALLHSRFLEAFRNMQPPNRTLCDSLVKLS
jgi:hypothetical protein